MKQDMSRRAFLGLGAMTAAVAGAGLAGCAPSNNSEKAADGAAEASAGGDVMAFEPSFLTAPAVPSEVKEEKDCDVVVVGYGLAGSAAAKAAAEEGAKVIVIEKQAENNYSVVSMAGDFGVVGSQIQKDLGIEWAPKEDIVNELMKDMAFRPDPKFLGYWYDHSGEDFDWFIEGADYEVLPTTAANQTTDNPNYIRPKCFPAKATTGKRSTTPTSTAPSQRTPICSGPARPRKTQLPLRAMSKPCSAPGANSLSRTRAAQSRASTYMTPTAPTPRSTANRSSRPRATTATTWRCAATTFLGPTSS